MLNAIAVSLTAYLLRQWGGIVGNSIQTKPLPKDSWVPGIPLIPGAPNEVLGLAVVAVVAGVGYAVLLNRTRFGFDLRATGASATAAVASGDRRTPDGGGLDAASPAASPALIGLPLLFGDTHSYGTTFQAGLGFTGIAVALLGRNHPVGIAFGALLFAFLDEQSSLLEINAGISNDIVSITQGVARARVVDRLRDRPPLHARRRAARGGRTARPGRTEDGGAGMTVANDAARPAASPRPRRRRRVPVVGLAAGRRSR